MGLGVVLESSQSVGGLPIHGGDGRFEIGLQEGSNPCVVSHGRCIPAVPIKRGKARGSVPSR